MRLMKAALWAAVTMVGFLQGASSTDSVVDYSSKNLSSVPRDLPPTVEFLDLSNNHIKKLHKGDFEKTTLLKFLNVSWNTLEEIDPETFLNTPLLQDLDLSHNLLKNLSGQHYLLHTGNLLLLNLACNMFPTMTLGSSFCTLGKLKRLAVGAKNISMGDFKNIAGLKLNILTLWMEDEPVYEAGSLKDVQAQRLQLTFTHNQIVGHSVVEDALSLFDQVELMNLTSGYWKLTKQLTERIEIHTSRFYLTNISIPWQDLTQFVNVILQTSLTHLGASDVTLTNLPFYDTYVMNVSKLNSFSARRVVVSSFFFSQEAVYNFFINMPVKRLEVRETSIIHMTCPKSPSPIVELDFSSCSMSDTIFSRVEDDKFVECETLGNLRELLLVGNNVRNLQLLSKRVQLMTSLQTLDLSLNSLFYNGLEECVWPSNIINMTLVSNGLTHSVFKCLPKGLQTLDLENNRISVVPSSILKMENLTSLNLNLNRLRDLPECHNFPILNKLLLRSNSLHVPSVQKLQSCPRLTTMDASSNPFTCTCALREFISFGIKSEENSVAGLELLGWPHDYYCIYPEDVRDSILKDILFQEVFCDPGILAVTILCPSVILIASVAGLCYCLDVRWYIRMICQWTRAKHRARRQQLRPEDLAGIQFHAFVSFSQKDADWVHNSLLPYLEGPGGGLRICHHEKNFVPGKTIFENIMGCVQKSRRSMFVLSAHFVKSEWCHYELYFASHQHVARRTDGIVLVLLEPLPQYTIPSKYYQLKAMMKDHTYLEWPQDKAKHRLFWANLRAALQADLPDAPAETRA